MDKELLRRLRLDFTKRETDLLPYIQTYFPEVSPSQLKAWPRFGASFPTCAKNKNQFRTDK